MPHPSSTFHSTNHDGRKQPNNSQQDVDRRYDERRREDNNNNRKYYGRHDNVDRRYSSGGRSYSASTSSNDDKGYYNGYNNHGPKPYHPISSANSSSSHHLHHAVDGSSHPSLSKTEHHPTNNNVKNTEAGNRVYLTNNNNTSKDTKNEDLHHHPNRTRVEQSKASPSPRYHGNPLSDRFSHVENKEIYERIGKLGEGTYGEVYKALNKHDNTFVAIKKIRIDPAKDKEGFPITAVREITALKELDHKNIVKLEDVTWNTKDHFFLVFEFVDHDLAGLNETGHRFDENELRSIMYQLLEALNYCHTRNIMHRDLKASNVLIKKDGTLKLADFGLSRVAQKNKQAYTNRVVTRWYRPPELLLGATTYDYSVDMWSFGCILGELLLPQTKTGEKDRALFMGSDDLDQLAKIFEWCGTPSVDEWPDVEKLEHWKDCKPQEPKRRRLRERFANLPYSSKVLDLLDKLLVLDPSKRISAKDCLDHDWFWEGGPPKQKPKNLPKNPVNEFLARESRKKIVGKDGIPRSVPSAPSHHSIPHSTSASNLTSLPFVNPIPHSTPGSTAQVTHHNPPHPSHSGHSSGSHHPHYNHHNTHHSGHYHPSSGSNNSGSHYQSTNNYHRDRYDSQRPHHDAPRSSQAPPNKKLKYSHREEGHTANDW